MSDNFEYAAAPAAHILGQGGYVIVTDAVLIAGYQMVKRKWAPRFLYSSIVTARGDAEYFIDEGVRVQGILAYESGGEPVMVERFCEPEKVTSQDEPSNYDDSGSW